MKKLIMLLSISFIVLNGCATSYQKEGPTGGYSDVRLSTDRFQVSFRGNGYTGSGKVQNFLLRRCAELTIDSGYKHFEIVNENIEATQQNLGTTYNGNITQNYSGSYNYSGTANTDTINRYRRTAIIRMFKEGSHPSLAYDAKMVLASFQK